MWCSYWVLTYRSLSQQLFIVVISPAMGIVQTHTASRSLFTNTLRQCHSQKPVGGLMNLCFGLCTKTLCMGRIPRPSRVLLPSQIFLALALELRSPNSMLSTLLSTGITRVEMPLLQDQMMLRYVSEIWGVSFLREVADWIISSFLVEGFFFPHTQLSSVIFPGSHSRITPGKA